MGVAKFVGSSRWMKWITEKDQGGDLCGSLRSGSNLRSDSASHRLAANCQPVPFQLLVLQGSVDHGAITSLEFRFRIGRAAALFHVEKIESHRVEATLGQAVGE